MNRDEIIQLLSAHRSDFRQLGIRSLALFGSVARNEATSQSDVDVLVEFEGPSGMFNLVRVQEFLESLLHRHVDVGTPQSRKPRMRSRVLAEAIQVA